MGSSSNYNVKLSFTADVNDAKRQIQSLQKSLQEVARMPGKPDQLFDDRGLRQASQAAIELQQHLSKAVNVDTGKLDLSRFSASLKASNKDLTTYYNTLMNAGIQGEDAFVSLAAAISQADIPTARLSKRVADLGVSIKNAAKWQISSSVIHGFMGAIQTAYGYAEDLNQSLNNIRIVTGQTVDQMDKFAASANKAAKALSATTLDYTNASLIYYQQGLTDEQVKERTDVTIKMANVAQQSATVVSDQMTAIWNNFYDGSKSLEYYADVLVKLGAATASSTDEIAGGLEKFAAIGNTIGLSYEYAAAALATITSNTRQSEEVVGTALKTIFARIQDLELGETLDDGVTLGSYSAALKKVGIEVLDATGEMRDMDDILDDLAAKWDSLNSATKTATAQAVAGTRQYVQLVALMDNWNTDDADSMTANLGYTKEATGELDAQADIYAESWEAARDRVQAAMEGIYTDLVDDDFFIGFTNGIGKAVEALSGFINAMGGMQGVISNVAAIFLTLYAKQMPETLHNFAQNIKSIVGIGTKETISMQKDAQNILKKLASDSFDVDAKFSAEAGAIALTNKAKMELTKNSARLSEQERLEAQMRMENITQLGKEAAALGKTAQEARKAQKQTSVNLSLGSQKALKRAVKEDEQLNKEKKAKKEAPVSSKGKTRKQEKFQKKAELKDLDSQIENDTLNKFKKELDTFGTEDEKINKVRNALSDLNDETNLNTVNSFLRDAVLKIQSLTQVIVPLQATQSSLETQTESWLQELSQLPKDTDKANASLKHIQESMVKYAAVLEDNVADSEIDVTDSRKTLIAALSKEGVSVEDTKKAWLAYKQALISAIKEQDVNSLLDTRDKYVKIFESLGQKDLAQQIIKNSDSVEEAITKLKQAFENMGEIVEEPIKHEVKFTEVLSQGASSLVSAYNAINSIKNAWNTISDPDATGWERIGAAVQVLIPAITAMNAITALNTTLTEFNTKRKLENAAASGKQAAGEVLANAKKSASNVILKIQDAIKSPLAQIAIVIAAVGVVVTGLNKAVDSLKDSYEKNQKVAEEAATAATNLANAYNEAATAYEELKSTVSDYSEAVDSIEKMRKGTDEYTEAIIKANEQARSLLETYGDIINGRYTIDSNGLINIDTAALEQIQQQSLKELSIKQTASILASQQAANAKNTAAITELNRTKIKGAEGFTADDLNETRQYAATGSKIGVIAGATIGTVGALMSGPAGWGLLLAGLLAAGGGGLAGGILGGFSGLIKGSLDSDSETEEEKWAIQQLTEAYKKSGNSIFTSVGTIAEALGENADANGALVKSLDKNKEAVEDLVQTIVQEEDDQKKQNLSAIEQMIASNYAVSQSENGSNISSLLLTRFTAEEKALNSKYMEQLTSGNGESIFAQYAALQGLDKLNMYELEEIDKKTGNATYKYYDEDKKEYVSVPVTANEIISTVVAKSLEPIINNEANQMVALTSNLTAKQTDILSAFTKDNAESLTYKQIMSFDSSDYSDLLLQQAGIDREALEEWIKGVQSNFTKWTDSKHASWFASLSEEDKTLLITSDIDVNDSLENVKDAFSRLQAYAQDHPLETTITAYNQLETYVKNGQWDELIKDLQKDHTEQEINDLLKLGDSDKIIAQIRRWAQEETSSDYTSTDTIEEAEERLAIEREEKVKTAEAYDAALKQQNAAQQAYGANYGKIDTSTAVKAIAEAQTVWYQWGAKGGSTVVNGVDYAGKADYEFLSDMAQIIQSAILNPDNVNAFDPKIISLIQQNGVSAELVSGLLQASRDSSGKYTNLDTPGLSDTQFLIMDGFNNLIDRGIDGITLLREDVDEIDAVVTDAQEADEKQTSQVSNAKTNLTNALKDDLIQAANYTSQISKAGLDEDTVNAYRGLIEAAQGVEDSDLLNQYFDKLSDKEKTLALDSLSIEVARLTTGLTKLGEEWYDWNEIMSDSEVNISKVASILPELNTAIANILNWDVSDVEDLGAEFYQTYWDIIQDIYNGVDGAVEKLSGLATIQYITSLNLDTSKAQTAYDVLIAELQEIPDLQIGMDLDDSAIKQKLIALFNAGVLVEDQVKNILTKLGYINIKFVDIYDDETDTYQGLGDIEAVYGGSGGLEVGSAKDLGKSKNKTIDLTKLSDTVKRYKKIDDAIEDNTQAMDRASDAADRLYGKARIEKMEKVNELIQEEVALNKQKREEALAYLKQDKGDLQDAASAAGYTFTFDEDGDITNYQEVMTALWKELHVAESSAMADNNVTDEESEKIEAIEKKISNVKEALEQYEETKGIIEDLDEAIQDAVNEWQDNNLEIFEEGFELEFSDAEEQLEELEYYMKKVEDDAYELAEAFGWLGSIVELNRKNYDTYNEQLTQLSDLYKTIDADGNRAISDSAYMEKLKEMQSNILSASSTLQEKDKEMMAYYGDALSTMSDEVDKYTSRFDDLNSVLDHYTSLMDIMGKSKNYQAMNQILKTQADISKNQADIATQQYESYKADTDYWKDLMETAKATGDEAAAEAYEQNYDAAYEKMVAAQDNMYEKTQEWLEKMKELYENQLAELGENLQKALTGGVSFDTLTTAMDRASSLQEEYLTTTNKIYETNKLMRTAQQEIDKSTNSVAKKRLAAFVNETQQLQDQTKLSNYELQIQQAKYDLLLAEIALQEAQDAKSTVRLKRDSEGNLGYVYTADSAAISEAEQNLADKQNSLYNIALEGANNYTEKYSQTMNDMYEALSELHEQYLSGEIKTEDEYNEAVRAAKEYYYQQLEDYSSLYRVAVTTDSRVIADAWSSDFSSMVNDTENLKLKVDEYTASSAEVLKNWSSDVQQAVKDTNLDQVEQDVKNIKSASEELRDFITDSENGLLKVMEEQEVDIRNISKAYADQRTQIGETITAYENLIKRIKDYKDAVNSNPSEGASYVTENMGDIVGEGTGFYKDSSSSNSSSSSSSSKGIAAGSYNNGTVSEDDIKGLQEYLKVAVDKKYGQNTQDAADRAFGGTDMTAAEAVAAWKIALEKEAKKQAKNTGVIIAGGGAASVPLYKQLTPFDTGGYTGEWGSYGKLAMLHQKELVLNAGDTENFLASMELLDHILEVIDLQSTSARLGGLLTSPGVRDNDSTIEQNVHIEASFPNVQNHSEIEEAFNNLINQASQYANRK